MTTKEIPEGVQTIARLSGEMASGLWEAISHILNTEDKVTRFNQTVAETVARLQQSGMKDVDIAVTAMSAAGDAILGEDRPSSPLEAMLRGAGPILQVSGPKRNI